MNKGWGTYQSLFLSSNLTSLTFWYIQLGFAKSWGLVELVGEGYTNLTQYYHRL
jgi:hypothetical protein